MHLRDWIPNIQHSRAYEALARLTNRYSLVPSQSYGVDLLPLIIPVTQLDELVRTPQGGTDTISITSAGTKDGTVVPSGKRWRLHMISAILASGTWTMSQVGIQDVSKSVTPILVHQTGQTALLWTTGHPVTLDEGDKIRVVVDGYTSTGDLSLRYWYSEEDAY